MLIEAHNLTWYQFHCRLSYIFFLCVNASQLQHHLILVHLKITSRSHHFCTCWCVLTEIILEIKPQKRKSKTLASNGPVSLSRIQTFPIAKTSPVFTAVRANRWNDVLYLAGSLLSKWKSFFLEYLWKTKPTHRSHARIPSLKVSLPEISPPSVNSTCVFLPHRNFANTVKYDYEHTDFVDTLSDFLHFLQPFSNCVCSLVAPSVHRGRREKSRKR